MQHLALTLLALGLATPLAAQGHHSVDDTSHTEAVEMGPHLRVTPLRPATAADSARGEEILLAARATMARYQAAEAAERDGYRRPAPREKEKKVLHFSNRANAINAREGGSFDPARPTSLLYRRERGGTLRLIGVMYTAPRSVTLDELDRRIPLALTQWHLHTNICLPAGRAPRQSADFTGPAARFGGRGSITTRDACEAASGRFRGESRSWMVHVNAAEQDPTLIWKHHQHRME